MLKDYLDREVYNTIIASFNFESINEIRLRLNQKIIVTVKNKKYFLKNNEGEFSICTRSMLDNFLRRAMDSSIYAYNDDIINGYLVLKNGVRVGLCGTVSKKDDKVLTIKDFQSINIRIPHFIKNCSLIAYDFLVDSEVKNTLIISPPGAGKTTFLRDFIYQLAQHNYPKNVLISDERNEICCINDGTPDIDLGPFCDIYTHTSKKFAFKNGIRSMCPDVIVTDEIDLEKDLDIILEAINSGVNVVATIHAKDLKQLENKPHFKDILDNKLFSRYVVLSNDDGPGTLKYIYDEKLNCLYCR